MQLGDATVGVFTCIVTFVIFTETDALQCYSCTGETNFDPSACHTTGAQTYKQTCKTGQVCEKKVQRIDDWQSRVERGCSNNCDGRSYIWTDEFQVWCCNKNDCNSAFTIAPSRAVYIASLFSALWTLLHLWT